MVSLNGMVSGTKETASGYSLRKDSRSFLSLSDIEEFCFTGVSCHFLLQEIFLIQGSNLSLQHCRQILYQLSYKGSGRILKWVAYPSSNREVNQNFQANFCPHKLPFLKNFVFVLYNWFFFFHLNTIHFHNYNNLYFVLLYFHFWVRLKSHCFPIALAIVSNL